MHCYGLGTEQDYKEAFKWFEKSAQEGNKFAQYSLANLYYYGNGIEKNSEKAFEWYKKSAAHGQPYASYAVAQMYNKKVNMFLKMKIPHKGTIKTHCQDFLNSKARIRLMITYITNWALCIKTVLERKLIFQKPLITSNVPLR